MTMTTIRFVFIASTSIMAASCNTRDTGDTGGGASKKPTTTTERLVEDSAVGGTEEVAGFYIHKTNTDPSMAPVVTSRVLRRFKNSPLTYTKPKSDVPQASVPMTPRELLLAKAAASPPEQDIRIAFDLPEKTFDWSPMKGLKDPTSRAAVVDARKAQLASSQAPLLAWLASAGATDIEPRWLTNSVSATLAASKVSAALAHPDLVGVSGTGVVSPDFTWTGKQLKDAIRATNFKNSGITGHGGGDTTHRVSIGVVESGGPSNMPYAAHPGFNRQPSEGGSRLTRVANCDSNPCANVVAAPTGVTHATRVAWVATGSIESGQDSNFPGNNTGAQQERSGVLRDAYLKVYVASNSDGLYRGIASALFDGVDIINLSWGDTANCAATADLSGINAALKSVVDFGIVVVKSAGNAGNAGGCTLGWPAQRSEVITVGGLETDPYPFNGYLGYHSLPVWSGSSRGGVAIVSHGGASSTRAGVDLIAPARFTSHFVPPGAGYATNGSAGTSLSAPAVAGMVGLLRNAFIDIGWGANNARGMMVNTLLMGDGWNGDSGTTPTTGLSTVSGAGRAKAHWPSSADLTGPWGWGWTAIHLNQFDSVTWTVGDAAAESSLVTQWKWAVLWTPTNLNNVPDVDFFVHDTCAGGATIAHDIGYDIRARFRLNQGQISGRCLVMRALAYSVPPEGVTIYTADYFHSGSTVGH